VARQLGYNCKPESIRVGIPSGQNTFFYGRAAGEEGRQDSQGRYLVGSSEMYQKFITFGTEVWGKGKGG